MSQESRAMQFKAAMKKLAQKNHVPAQAVLQNFMLEKVLGRIAASPHKDHFVLKGGMLIGSLVGVSSRTTMDMDATLRGFPLTETRIRDILTEICAMPLADEITLELGHIEEIREADEYGGYRAALTARFESILTPLKLDITTGDRMTPDAVEYAFPSSFDEKTIPVWAYNLETILAEKVETILRRSLLNTRLRDFYDVHILMHTQQGNLQRETFATALRATAEKRLSLPALAEWQPTLQALQTDPTMRQRWERYSRDNRYTKGVTFDQTIEAIRDLLGNLPAQETIPS